MAKREHRYHIRYLRRTWLERLVWDKLCAQYGVNSIEKVDGVRTVFVLQALKSLDEMFFKLAFWSHLCGPIPLGGLLSQKR